MRSRDQEKATRSVVVTVTAATAAVMVVWLQSLVPAPGRVSADAPALSIHDIQGSGVRSPYAGQTVTATGVVTATRSNGFFIQAPDVDADSDPNTSEAIFVFTGGPPSDAKPGFTLRVRGLVAEFVPSSDPSSPPLTEIQPALVEEVSASPAPLPAPITLTSADTSPSGSIEQLERFEGMRVHVDSLTIVAPTDGTVDERNAASISNGVFYGVVTGLARPFREPGVRVPNSLPGTAPCCVPRFDANPERLRVDSDGQRGASPMEVSTGATIVNLVGVLDYSSRAYTILLDPGSYAITPGLTEAVPVPAPAADEFALASFNLERFFDTTDDSGVSDIALTADAFARRLRKLSLAIRNVLRSPDIIAVEEVEKVSTLSAIASRVNFDSGATRADEGYQALLLEGNDPGGINVGILFRFPRVALAGITQLGKDATFTNPGTGTQETLFDRPPLLVRLNLQVPGGFGLPVILVINHLRSLSGIDDSTDGPRVRAKRRAQAEFVANAIQARQAADPTERIISLGDYNAFEFNDGYVDVIGTIKGMPASANEVVLASADLVTPDLSNLTDLVPADQAYSFVFDGNAQALDHILVTANMVSRVSGVHYARLNADFPESFRNDPTRPERISDHDVPVAYFKLLPPGTDLSLTKTASPATVRARSQVTYTIVVKNNGSTQAETVSVVDLLIGMGFVSVASTQGTCSGPPAGSQGAVRCQVGSLAPGGSATMTLVATITLVPQFPMQMTNSALATGLSGGQINQVNAAATITVLPVPDIIAAVIDGRRLIVDGLNFLPGAVIEINGQPQKTVNDEQLPNIRLIAKKGGKRIRPGETTILTVLNPDGVRSAPFNFTRPAE